MTIVFFLLPLDGAESLVELGSLVMMFSIKFATVAKPVPIPRVWLCHCMTSFLLVLIPMIALFPVPLLSVS